DLGTEIGIFVALSEPIANAPLAARRVVIYCEIDSSGEMNTRRTAGGFCKQLSDPARLENESSGRRGSRPPPTIGVLDRPAQRIFVMPTKNDRQPRFLDRLRLDRDVFEIPKPPVKTCLRFVPKQFHDLNRFREPRHSPFAGITEDVFVRA